MSIEDIAIACLNRRFNNLILTAGWRAELHRQARMSAGEVDGYWVRLFPFRPDGYLRLSARLQPWLVAIEVEDTNPLSRQKLAAYANLWFEFDRTDRHNLALVTTDRYGRAQVLDLQDVYYSFNKGEEWCRKMMGHVDQPTIDDVVGMCAKHRSRVPSGGRREQKRRQMMLEGMDRDWREAEMGEVANGR